MRTRISKHGKYRIYEGVERKTVSVWFPFLDDSPVKIKRLIPRSETGITGDTVREDTK